MMILTTGAWSGTSAVHVSSTLQCGIPHPLWRHRASHHHGNVHLSVRATYDCHVPGIRPHRASAVVAWPRRGPPSWRRRGWSATDRASTSRSWESQTEISRSTSVSRRRLQCELATAQSLPCPHWLSPGHCHFPLQQVLWCTSLHLSFGPIAIDDSVGVCQSLCYAA